MGRPAKEAHERRTASLPPVRVTVAEMAFVQAQAEAAGLALSDYLRQRATGAEVKARRTVQGDQLLVEMNRAGVNLNQIARALNSGAGVPSDIGQVLRQFQVVLEKVGRAHGA